MIYLDGRCVRLDQGDYQQYQIYHENPVEVARMWADQGATRLHLVDLDGAKVGQPVNLAAIKAIIRAVDIPVQVVGLFHSHNCHSIKSLSGNVFRQFLRINI